MLNKEMVRQGTRLFRWRSYLPLALLPIGIAAIWESGDFDRWLGEPVEEQWARAAWHQVFKGERDSKGRRGAAPRRT